MIAWFDKLRLMISWFNCFTELKFIIKGCVLQLFKLDGHFFKVYGTRGDSYKI